MSNIHFVVSALLTSKSIKDPEGTALAVLSALMKAIRMNSARPVAFLLRERLPKRDERRQVNVLLNAISAGIAKAKSDRLKKVKPPVEKKVVLAKAPSRQAAKLENPVSGTKSKAVTKKELKTPSSPLKQTTTTDGINRPGETVVVDGRPTRDLAYEYMTQRLGITEPKY